MKWQTYSQRKIARTEFYLEETDDRFKCIEGEIQQLNDRIAKLQREKTKVDSLRFRLHQHIGDLTSRFVNSKGARFDQPLEADCITYVDGSATWKRFAYRGKSGKGLS
jgi:septal ring factor EnvC (AmiA/AmiB activator)